MKEEGKHPDTLSVVAVLKWSITARLLLTFWIVLLLSPLQLQKKLSKFKKWIYVVKEMLFLEEVKNTVLARD